MANTNDQGPETSTETRQDAREGVPAEAKEGSAAAPADRAAHPDHRAAGRQPILLPHAARVRGRPPSHPWRRGLLWAGAVAGLAFGGYALAPTVKTMMETVSTDDAYVNGHVTYVAPRVAGQVSRVLVDDNDRVSKGDLLVQLDREPYQVQVDLKKAAVVNAEVDVEAAGPRSGASWPRPGASAGSSRGRSRTSTTRWRSSRPGSRPCGARRRASTAPGRLRPGPAALQQGRDRPRGVRPAP